MYKTSQTPNSATLPDDALIEIETAAGGQEHILGEVLNVPIAVNAANIATNAAALLYTVSHEVVPFVANKSHGAKMYYRLNNINITIPTRADGGYELGDEITLMNVTGGGISINAGVLTVNVPSGSSLAFASVGSVVTLVCVGDTEWDARGGLA